jgi:hypothetical protein
LVRAKGFIPKIYTCPAHILKRKVENMKGIPTSFAVILAVLVAGVLPVAAQDQCPKHTHYLAEGYSFSGGNLVFNYLDMDIEAPTVQHMAVKRPGERVTAVVSWTWGTSCPDCTVNINAWGSWSKTEIAKLYSGKKGKNPSTVVLPVSFKAPDSPGEYEFRIIFAYDKDFAGDFNASSPCSKEECEERGECHILMATGLLNVTRESIGDLPPLVRIISPVSNKVSGEVEIDHGSKVSINARVDDPETNITILLDGAKIGQGIPFTWDTENYSLGRHEIVLQARNQKGHVGTDVVLVRLVNLSTPQGNPPPLAWSLAFGKALTAFDITPGGEVLVALGGELLGFDRQGRKEWGYRPPTGVENLDISDGGEMVVASGGGTLYALDGKGRPLWNTTAIGSHIDQVAVSASGLSAARSSNNIYALDRNGSILWTTTITDIEAIAVLDSGLVATNSKDNVYLIDNGSLLWTYPATNLSGVRALGDGIIAYSDDVVYFLNQSGGLEDSFKSDQIIDVAVAGDSILLLGSNSLESYSLEGDLLWKYPLLDGEGLAAQPGLVIYSKDNGIYLLSALPVEETAPSTALPSWAKMAGAAVGVLLLLLALLLVRRRRKKPREEAVAPPEGLAGPGEKTEKPGAVVEEGRVIVRVKNAKNKKDIADARVTLGGETRTTDQRGEVIFTGVPPGRFTLVLEASSYGKKELEGTRRWEEEYIDAELVPHVPVADSDLQPMIQGITEALEGSFEKASRYDRCIPSYLREVALGFVNVLREMAYSPEYFSGDSRPLLREALEVVEGICTEIGLVMTDWKNMRIYQASMELGEPESPCRPGAVPWPDLADLFRDPEGYRAGNLSRVERRLTDLDSLINSKMKELTVLPAANLWSLASRLVRDASSGGMKGAFSLFAADVLCIHIEGMFESEEIVKRLSFSLL